ncbi:MAG: 5'/3'-nucleotidase SurE [Clostridiales bacterium]|jgi:5'-nucleotidase|nr:5'/3'-nucleotidase SurE [Clostridiales bacterium]
MTILLTNDDGIFADGIRILAEKLSKKHEVIVAAPDSERSGTSHSLTIFKRLTYRPYGYIDGVRAYSISGTPADCVKFATMTLMKKAPDLVVSGINNMPNLGTDVIYSGTVNAALEGVVCGIRSIALSVLYEDDGDYEYVSEFMLSNLEKIYGLIPKNAAFNINFPSGKKSRLRGVGFAALGIQSYSDEYVPQGGDDGGEHYILTGDFLKNPDNAADCDVEMHDAMYVTITPLRIQTTDFDALARLKKSKASDGITL